jgi:hypothetical protein
MHSKQELEQTIALNAMLTRRCIRREELIEALSAHGIIESNNPMPNYIKSLALNLERRFQKLNITLFNVSAKMAAVYSVTDEALEFAQKNLLTPLYNEEGEMESCIYQHPIVLETDRMMLV